MSPFPPTVRLDHVLIAVTDLAAGARWLEAEYGLRALPGGRHPGAGTANMIVPLGSVYLELIAAVDSAEAASAPTAQWGRRAVTARRRFAAWAVRTEALDALRDHLVDAGWDLPEPARGIRAVRLEDPDPAAASARLRTLLGSGTGVSVERSSATGIVAVEIDAPGGEMVLR